MESEQLLQEQPQVIEQSLPTEPTMDNNNYEYQPPQQPEFNENINNVVQQPYVNVNVESVENNVTNPENVVIPDNMINMNMDIMDTIDNLDNLDNIPNPEIRIPAIDDLQPQPQPAQEIQNIQQEPLPMQQEEKTQQMQVIQEEIQPQMSEENIIIPQQESQHVPQPQEEFAPNLPPDIPEDSPQQEQQTNVQQEAQEPPQQQQETHVHENQRMMVDYDNRYQQQQILQQPPPQSQSHVQVQVQVDDNKMMVDHQQEQEQPPQEDIKPQLPEPMETDDIEPPIEPPPPPPQQHIPQRITPTNNNSNNQNRNQSQNNMIPELVQCKNLLIEFMKRPETEPFNEPVDWKGLNLPDYPLTITKPMDLGSILNKLAVNKYKTADQFASDVRLVFRNAKHYNQVASGIYVVAENLLKQFERRFARIRKNNGNKKRKYSDKMNNNGQESSYKQRKEFTTLIQSLTPNELGGIVELIDKKSPMALNDIAGGKDELEIEVYHIDGQTLTDLIVHIEKTIAKRGKKKKKTYGY